MKSLFFPDKDRKICCAGRVIGGSGQKTQNSLVGVCGHIIKKRECQSGLASSGSRRRSLLPGLESSELSVTTFHLRTRRRESR